MCPRSHPTSSRNTEAKKAELNTGPIPQVSWRRLPAKLAQNRASLRIAHINLKDLPGAVETDGAHRRDGRHLTVALCPIGLRQTMREQSQPHQLSAA